MKEAANRGGLANLKVVSLRSAFAPLGRDWFVLIDLSPRPAWPPYRTHNPDQQDRADEPGNQVADPAP